MTDRTDTWLDEFLVAMRAYFGVLEMLEMTEEQREEYFERDNMNDCLSRSSDIPQPEDNPR